MYLVIPSGNIMDIEFKCPHPSKVNGKCVYKGKFRKECLIYEVKLSLCDAIYICNTQQIFKKSMDGHFSNVQHLIKIGQKLDSFAAHFE